MLGTYVGDGDGVGLGDALLARFAIPDHWRCVVAVPQGAPGLSGEAEAAAFERFLAGRRHIGERFLGRSLGQVDKVDW